MHRRLTKSECQTIERELFFLGFFFFWVFFYGLFQNYVVLSFLHAFKHAIFDLCSFDPHFLFCAVIYAWKSLCELCTLVLFFGSSPTSEGIRVVCDLTWFKINVFKNRKPSVCEKLCNHVVLVLNLFHLAFPIYMCCICIMLDMGILLLLVSAQIYTDLKNIGFQDLPGMFLPECQNLF